MEQNWLTSAKSVFSGYASGIIEAGDITGQKALGAALGIKQSVGESVQGWKYGFGLVGKSLGEVPEIVQREAKESYLGIKYGFGVAGAKIDQMSSIVQQEAKKSALGWSYGFSEAGKSIGGVGEGIKDYFGSVKMWLWIPIALIVFILLMVSVGYSGLGGPAARVAEREYVRRR
jgi:hypothetical protein